MITKNKIRIKPKKNIQVSRESKLRIIPLGGQEEVGRNMTVFEYGNDIVILDMGIQFPEEDMPGVDYIIPNTKYLEGKERNVRAVVFSHGHLDHIGAAPIILEKLGYPLVVARDLTIALVKNRLEDYQKGSCSRLKTIAVKNIDDVVKVGNFTIKFFQVEHSIVDSIGVVLETPVGSVIHPGDWTIERNRLGFPTIDYSALSEVKKPSILMLESLGSTKNEKSPNSEEVYRNLHGIMSQARGRVIIGTFASQISRIKWIIESAQQIGRKVALDGYSMKINVKISSQLGYIKIKKGSIIDIRNVASYPDGKVVIICTGAQGEEHAVLPRIVAREHPYVRLKKTDTVIFSSSVIPGNERSIQRLKDNIYRQCDHVIHSEIMDVHVSGHANRQDILDMLRMINPTYFIPVYANHYFLKEAASLAALSGFPKSHIFVPDNGSIIEVGSDDAKILDKKVPTNYVFVDGLGISDMQNVVLRDRQVLSEDGMVVLIVTFDSRTGKLIQNPDIISRGFVFLKGNKKLIEDLRQKVKRMVLFSDRRIWADASQIKDTIRDEAGQFLFQKTQKRPMILPVVIEV